MSTRAGAEFDPNDDPYYQYDGLLGEAPIEGKPTEIYLRLHESTERYWQPTELFPLKQRPYHQPGTQLYFHAKPYIRVPDLQLTIALRQGPKLADMEAPVGHVAGVEHRGLKRQEIGQAQAWYYQEERALVLWECFLERPYRSGDDPTADQLHRFVWQGFERSLLAKLRQVERIFTTWEPIYARSHERSPWTRFGPPAPANGERLWQHFLEQEGYHQIDTAAFAKEVKR